MRLKLCDIYFFSVSAIPHTHYEWSNLLMHDHSAIGDLLKGHSGFENGFLRALSTFGSSPNDTMHTN